MWRGRHRSLDGGAAEERIDRSAAAGRIVIHAVASQRERSGHGRDQELPGRPGLFDRVDSAGSHFYHLDLLHAQDRLRVRRRYPLGMTAAVL
jgi:hypothetical protein